MAILAISCQQKERSLLSLLVWPCRLGNFVHGAVPQISGSLFGCLIFQTQQLLNRKGYRHIRTSTRAKLQAVEVCPCAYVLQRDGCLLENRRDIFVEQLFLGLPQEELFDCGPPRQWWCLRRRLPGPSLFTGPGWRRLVSVNAKDSQLNAQQYLEPAPTVVGDSCLLPLRTNSTQAVNLEPFGYESYNNVMAAYIIKSLTIIGKILMSSVQDTIICRTSI